MNQSPFKCFATCTTHPLLKNNALRLVSNKGHLKRLLLLHKQILKPSMAVAGDAFCHFPPVPHTPFKTKVLRLIKNEG